MPTLSRHSFPPSLSLLSFTIQAQKRAGFLPPSKMQPHPNLIALYDLPVLGHNGSHVPVKTDEKGELSLA